MKAIYKTLSNNITGERLIAIIFFSFLSFCLISFVVNVDLTQLNRAF